MDEEIRRDLMRKKLKASNGGQNWVVARYHAKYPESGEREYIRLCDSYMAIEKQVLLKYIPELKCIISDGTKLHMDSTSDNDEKRKKRRFEYLDNTIRRFRILFETIRQEVDSSFGLYHLSGALKRVAALDHKLSVKEWKKTIARTLGIDILEDYYSGEFYREMLEKWVADNVNLITSVKDASLEKMKEIVYTNFMEGKSTTSIIKRIQHQYGMDKRHARMIARDQTAKLNAALTKHQQTDAGIVRYEWSTSLDARVRAGDKMGKGTIDPMGDNHKRLEGKIFRWDAPPLVDRKRGRRCHPGEDYQCRCCALPIFDFDTLDLPA